MRLDLHKVSVLVLVIGLAVTVACGGSATSAATPTSVEIAAPTPGPTQTPQPTATSTPAGTATPVPATPTAQPTPTPFVEHPLRNPALSSLVAKPYPAQIDPDLVDETPTEDEVIAAWTEYFTDSIISVYQNGNMHFCGDGTVISAHGNNVINLWVDTPDKWLVDRNAGQSSAKWWEVILTAFFSPESGRREPSASIAVIGIENGSATIPENNFGSSRSVPLTVYESEYCKIR